MLKHKHMLCMLVTLIIVVLFLIYLSYNGSLPGGDSCGCSEKMAYLPKPKERMAKIPPPQFKRMQGVERFISRETSNPSYSASDYQNTNRERFSDDFDYPSVTGMSMVATAQSPYIGKL